MALQLGSASASPGTVSAPASRSDFVSAFVLLKQSKSREAKQLVEEQLQAVVELWADIMLVTAGMEVVDLQASSDKTSQTQASEARPTNSEVQSAPLTSRPEASQSASFAAQQRRKISQPREAPSNAQAPPAWMQARLNTPSRPSRTLPTVFEVKTEEVQPDQKEATDSITSSRPQASSQAAEDHEIPAFKPSLLFGRSLEAIKRSSASSIGKQNPSSPSIKSTFGSSIASPARTFEAIAIRQPHAPNASGTVVWTQHRQVKAFRAPPECTGEAEKESSPADQQPAQLALNQATKASACSSCGVSIGTGSFATLKPCLHLLCTICVNALINSACLDPPPDTLRCFFCAEEVTGFEKRSLSESIADSTVIKSMPSTPSKIAASDQAPGLSPLRQLNWAATPSSMTFSSPDRTSSSSGEGASSLWSTPESQRSLKSAISTPSSAPRLKDAPEAERVSEGKEKSSRPVVRIDNISWKLTTQTLLEWLPAKDLLPPPDQCPSPLHILCTPDDGKTLNYAFIELKDLRSAHRLVRERGIATGQVPRIGGRPCSVSLASVDELRYAIFGDCDMVDLSKMLLKLCDVTRAHVQKAPERPFLHLASMVAHLASQQGISDRSLNALWTNYESAVGKAKQRGMTDALNKMVDTAVSSQDVDDSRKLRVRQAASLLTV